MVTFLAIVFFFLLEALLHYVNTKVSDITRTFPTETGYLNWLEQKAYLICALLSECNKLWKFLYEVWMKVLGLRK
jgi:hypothetical protein